MWLTDMVPCHHFATRLLRSSIIHAATHTHAHTHTLTLIAAQQIITDTVCACVIHVLNAHLSRVIDAVRHCWLISLGVNAQAHPIRPHNSLLVSVHALKFIDDGSQRCCTSSCLTVKYEAGVIVCMNIAHKGPLPNATTWVGQMMHTARSYFVVCLKPVVVVVGWGSWIFVTHPVVLMLRNDAGYVSLLQVSRAERWPQNMAASSRGGTFYGMWLLHLCLHFLKVTLM